MKHSRLYSTPRQLQRECLKVLLRQKTALQNPPCDPSHPGWATYMEYGSLRSMCGITR
jgi:hypothetical protein